MSPDELEAIRVVTAILDDITTSALAIGGGVFLWRAMREEQREHIQTLRKWNEYCEQRGSNA